MSKIEEGSVSKELCRIRPIIGTYEFEQFLGRGAFAEVYRARDIRNGPSVAIKVIIKKFTGSNDSTMFMSSNIKREASIMGSLHHPNIIRLHEVMVSKTRIYLVMEFVKCGDLARQISKGRFSENDGRKYFQQLISAVDYCHLNGVFHRDLKPENVLLDENGDLKVSDFGISAMRNQVREDGLLHTICGTPAYMAPEILRNKGYDGAKIDVWSCGVILYALTAGYLPFYNHNIEVMYEKIYRGKYTCPNWMSVELKRFLSRLLDKNPMTRMTIDDIKPDPWFRKELKEKKLDEIKPDHQLIDGPSSLNAFHLISFSPGLDLSGLFNASCSSMENSLRLAVEQSPEVVMERVCKVAKEVENATLKRTKKWWYVELQGHSASGNFKIELEVFLLTNNFVVLEATSKTGAANILHELWEEKIKTAILGQQQTLHISEGLCKNIRKSTNQIIIKPKK